MFFKKKSKEGPRARKLARLAVKTGSKPTQLMTKQFTVKQFKKFSPEAQQLLTNRYNVTLTDHSTKREKLSRIRKTGLRKNIVKTGRGVDRGITRFNNIMNTVDVGLKEIDRTFAPKKSKSSLDRLAGL